MAQGASAGVVSKRYRISACSLGEVGEAQDNGTRVTLIAGYRFVDLGFVSFNPIQMQCPLATSQNPDDPLLPPRKKAFKAC